MDAYNLSSEIVLLPVLVMKCRNSCPYAPLLYMFKLILLAFVSTSLVFIHCYFYFIFFKNYLLTFYREDVDLALFPMISPFLQ